MVIDSLNELVSLSDQLAAALGKPTAKAVPPPENTGLPDELVSVLSCGALAFKRQGVDMGRIEEFTRKARKRGMRRNVLVFGWHPRGHTWLATPINHNGESTIIEINRLERLKVTELSVTEFIDKTIERTREAIVEANKPESEKPAPKVRSMRNLVRDEEEKQQEQQVKKRPPIKVVLEPSGGATVTAGDTVEELAPDDFAYLIWCMNGLQMLHDVELPDLSRWEARALQRCELDAVPGAGTADHDRYQQVHDRLTRRDRFAPGPVSHQIPRYKFTEPGTWGLAPNELDLLRRNERAKPPRHRPGARQKALWARWVGLLASDRVTVTVHPV